MTFEQESLWLYYGGAREQPMYGQPPAGSALCVQGGRCRSSVPQLCVLGPGAAWSICATQGSLGCWYQDGTCLPSLFAVREHLPLSELQVGRGSRTGGMQLWLGLALGGVGEPTVILLQGHTAVQSLESRDWQSLAARKGRSCSLLYVST